MKLKLREVCDIYPLKLSRIAANLGRSREWIHRLATNPAGTPEVYKANILMIQQYLRALGKQLTEITLSGTDEPGAVNIETFFRDYPFTVNGMARHLGYTREFVSQIAFNRYGSSQKARTRNILKIQEAVRALGREFENITLIH